MKLSSKHLIIVIGLLLLISCDLTSKKVAHDNLKEKPPTAYLDGHVTLIYAENTAGMLSFGDELSEGIKFVIFQVGVALVLILCLFYLFRNTSFSMMKIIAYTLFISGGLGNLINRMFLDGKVIDFVVFRLFGYHTGIFNIADVYILSGVFLLIIMNIFNKTKKEELSQA